MSTSNSNNREMDNKRKRLTQACELCRRKKIRCDGGKPTCGNCTRLKSECTYSSTSKKRGPRQGYIEMLEQRLAKMEKILLSPEKESASNQNKNTAVSNEHEEEVDDEYEDDIDMPPLSASTTNTSNTFSIKSSKSSSFDNTNTNQGHTTTTTNNNNNNKYSKRLSEDINHDCASPTSFSSISSNFPSPPAHVLTQQSSSRSDSDVLPSMDVILHMVDLFFTNLYATAPIFDEKTLRNDIKERRCSDFLLLSLLGACARYSDRPDIKENPAWHAGEKYAEKARPMILKAVDEPSLSNLQALTLLTLHEYGCGRGPRSWMYGGMTIRMAMEMGLHEDPEEEECGGNNHTYEKLVEEDTRRRLFWTIFCIDKFSSAATGRPSSIQENFCTAFLPATLDLRNREQYYTETLNNNRYILLNINGLRESSLLGTQQNFANSPTSSFIASPITGRRPHLDIFAYLIRATSLLGKVTAYVNLKGKSGKNELPPCHPESEFSKLDKSIEEWYDQLPRQLKNTPANFELYRDQDTPANNRQFILLHVLYNTLRVLLHRPSLVVADTLNNDAVQPDIKEFVIRSVDNCMAAVDNVTVLLKEVGKQPELIPPFLTYLAYTVATVVVSTSFSPRAEEAQKAKQALGVYFQLLLNARSYWAMADKLYFMIRDLYAIHNNVLRRQAEHVLNQQQEDLQRRQREQQLQEYQQQQQMQQQLQIQQLSQLELPVAGSTSSLGDWNLPFYNAALSEVPPGNNNYNYDSRNDFATVQANVFQLPEGYDQPLMFPTNLAQNRDVNGM